MTPAPFACPLADADRVPGCGGKAIQLAHLLKMSLRVPVGLVITDTAFQAFLDHNGLRQAADEIASLLERGTAPEVNALAATIRQRVLTAELSASIRESMQNLSAMFARSATLIVRSSALGEDGMTASFAGQLDSILNVKMADLGPALLACWASYWSERVLFYQRARGVRLTGMGVIVQEQIQPAFAGVLFTANLDGAGGRTDDLLVEYHGGHGEELVQGRVDPGRALIARDGARVRHLAAPESDQAGPDDAIFFELARAGLMVENARGLPQDIEWALDSERRLWLVQARPITHGAMPTTGTPERVFWSNANVNENYPEPISPLLYSIASTSYYHYFRNLGLVFGLAPERVAAMEQPLRRIIGVHGARMYYHLTHIHAVLRAAPFGEQLAEYFSAFTGAEPPTTGQREAAGLRAWVEAAVIAIQGARVFRTLPKRVADFEATVDRFAERTAPERLATEDLSGLLEAFRGFLDIRFHRWTGASLADAAAMISYGLLQRLLRREFPDADQSALHNTLLKGLSNVVSSAPLTEVWRLSRILRNDPEAAHLARLDNDALLAAIGDGKFATFGNALQEYLRTWGFRRSGELMLTLPGFQEEPGPLLDILRAYALVDGDSPADRLDRQHRERTTETQRVLNVLRGRRLARWLPWPTAASVARHLLHWCQGAIALRERARTRQALLYARCRGIALAIGRQLAARGDLDRADDVFFLTYQEIEELLGGGAMFPHHVRDLVRLRYRAHAEVSAHKPLDVLTLPMGAYLPTQRAAPKGEAAHEDGDQLNGSAALTGVGACGGKATGPAAVLKDVAECTRLAPGDVLVTRQTDPGWGPAFLLIRGLILERGGMLSHGAILAREFGIPTVVGVRDAVRRIRPGQILQVDGDRGVVQFVER